MDSPILDTTVGRNQNRYSFMETPREMNPPSRFPSPTLPHADSRAPTEEPLQQQDTWTPTPNEKTQFHNQGILPDYTNCPPPEQHPANYAPFADTSAQHQSTQIPSYSTAHGSQQQDAPIVTQYATAYGNSTYTTQTPSQPYTNQSFSNLPQHAVSPHPYTSQHYTNIPLQQGTMSHQRYFDSSDYQCTTPVSAQPYAYSHTQSYTTMPEQTPQNTHITPQPYTYNEQTVPTPTSPGPLPLKMRPGALRSNTVNIAPDENPLQSPQQTYFPHQPEPQPPPKT
ncbi:uncharacterized protein N7506_008665 [Penicillium brevicompactum]|uniref:uncharacterized protein n=1 Tax=Penicillium brevicompactum TaxID=5074 RepID=UPI002540D150|nr:uncharacterized protein N7506_008665 [Penicillium brevicompactum]KAJ5325563.1 hypothetical protein N7506_008665 [Penicillium brevicompactum]